MTTVAAVREVAEGGGVIVTGKAVVMSVPMEIPIVTFSVVPVVAMKAFLSPPLLSL